MPDHVLGRVVKDFEILVAEKQLIVKSSVGYSVDSWKTGMLRARQKLKAGFLRFQRKV